MGLCIDERGLTLTCDGQHGDDVPPSATFKHPDGYIGEYREAMAAGWKDTFTPSPGSRRVFFGPCCSGKRGVTT
jgi:hypothetical protein